MKPKIDRTSELNDAVTNLEATATTVVNAGNDPGTPWSFAREVELTAHGGRINAEVALATMQLARWTRVLAFWTAAASIVAIVAAGTAVAVALTR